MPTNVFAINARSAADYPFIGRDLTPSQLGHDLVFLHVAKRDEQVQSFGTLGLAATVAGHSALHFENIPWHVSGIPCACADDATTIIPNVMNIFNITALTVRPPAIGRQPEASTLRGLVRGESK